MDAGKVDFRALDGDDGVTWTLLGTLYLRAWESRGEHSILRDHYAAEALERIDYDFAALKKRLRPQSSQYLVALRARQLDEWATDFLASNPDATVLQLGCGLDSRMLRIQPPAGVRWFDLDLPEVIELRRRIYPERDSYTMIGASVLDLARVPTDRPVLVIAEGLLMYLSADDNQALFQRLTDRFGSGELIFDAVAPWLARLIKVWHWGPRDAREIERWNPRLRCVAEASYTTHYARIPVRFYRDFYHLSDHVRPLRNIFPQFRFRFSRVVLPTEDRAEESA